MPKRGSMLIRILSYFAVLAVVLFSASCSSKRMVFTILFKQGGDLKKGSPVFLGSVQVGKVTGINKQKGKMAVRVQIFGGYKDQIKMKSAFYILGSGEETHIYVETIDESSPPLATGSVVKGSAKYKYWLSKDRKKAVKELIEKGIDKTVEFFQSDEWRNFRDDMKKNISEAGEKGRKELKKQLPQLKEQAKEFYERVKAQSPKEAARVKAYVDSLFKEAEESE